MIEKSTLSAFKKILIVDDDQGIVEILKRLFERKGYKICIATNGKEALERIEDETPDLIILDLVLPLIPGEEVCKKIRRNEKFKDIPIIMLTGKCEDTDRIIGKVIGANYYLTKPCNMTELSLTVDSAFGIS
ncbi:MAG: response regulator [Candidatus Omnitrophica bacterium]|nr:response regulator [Candidatus Omnitrophota bacterium]